jgi:hypothetical protein
VPDSPPIDPDSLEHAPGFSHAQLEGAVLAGSSESEIRQAVEAAFDYRGDVTVKLKDGRSIEGFIFDRRVNAANLADCSARLVDKTGGKTRVAYPDIAEIAFSGKDTAAGKSFETWVKKYKEKKAAGETNIRLEPEKLD